MKTVFALPLALALLTVALTLPRAQTATAPQPLKPAPASVNAPMAPSLSVRRWKWPPSIQAPAKSSAPSDDLAAPVYRPKEAASDPDETDWAKFRDRATWRKSDKDSETTIGVYKRPAPPDIPPPQVQREDDGQAAGVSVSFKLGVKPSSR